MPPLTAETIKKNFADSALIYERGLGIYQNGAFVLQESDPDAGVFRYEVDGSSTYARPGENSRQSRRSFLQLSLPRERLQTCRGGLAGR